MTINAVRSINVRRPSDLDAYRDQKRLLLLFAASPTQPAYEQQQTLLRGQESGREERDLMVFQLFADGISYVGEVQIDAESAAQLRQQFAVPDQAFALVLIGKDGNAKWQSDRPTPLSSIFAIIDSMPMRQQEKTRL